MAGRLALGLAFIVLLSATQANEHKKRQSQQPTCSAKSDVVFLLDSSDAVSKDNFQQELDFVQRTVSKWDVQPNGVQVGLASFGAKAQAAFNLNSHATGQDVLNALKSVPSEGGRANLQEALRFTTQNMFSPQSGVRGQAAKVIIMVTNGQSPNKDLTILQSKTTQNNDIQVYTVGVGASVNPAELREVASNPASRYFYTADTFQSTPALADIIGPKICNEVPHDASFLPPAKGCLQKADVVFLLDSSSTIGKDNFHKLQDFLKDVVQDLNVAPDGVHVGLMQYSSYPSLEFPLDMHTSRYDVLKAVDHVRFMGGNANTADALEYMRRLGFSQNSGARAQVPRIAVVITDGSSPNSAQVAVQANNARVDNIGLISVGVGSNINTAELQTIADDPDKDNMFVQSDYNKLNDLTNRLLQATCRVQATVPPNAGVGNHGTQAPDPCQDVEDCVNYGSDVCTTYADWSKLNCRRYCRFCNPLYTDAPPTCDDMLPNCASYGVASCSGIYFGWAKEKCKRFCGYCETNREGLGYYGKCNYKEKSYVTGEKWTDGCDYECICEDGNTGKYRCFNKCPVYHNLPSQCTLVKDPSTCCLQPKCNFQQIVNTVQGSAIGNVNGIGTCLYKGQNYYVGQQWQDGCSSVCTCRDGQTGNYACQDLCPTYPSLPSYCHLEKEAGSCCPKAVCEFDQQQGTFSGFGTVSGTGIDTLPPTLPPCVDHVDNCPMYGKPACQQYKSWSLQNCRKFCDFCSVDRLPGANDVCVYDGKQYHQDDFWFVGCNTRCVCEKATQGYYRCDDLCPRYTNIPPTCKLVKPAGACCQSLQCGSGTFISSTNNLNTIGNGGNIFTGANYVPPTLATGGQAPPGTGDSVFHAPSIPGCLYKGQVYVQGQKWDDGCNLACECQEAATGRYRCRGRCPTYPSPPAGCSMVTDETDTCCLKPHCTGPAALTYVPIPAYGQYQSQGGVAKPPSSNHRYTGTANNFGPHGGQATVIQFGTTVPPPTVGGFSSGGIGHCEYKGKTYAQSEAWEDGCDYNCVCDDASFGHFTCVTKCVVYNNIPKPYCHLITDPANPCCQIPSCVWTAPPKQVTGMGEQHPSTLNLRSTQPPTPAFAFCEFNGTHYDKNQIWYKGCDFKCTCEEPATNNYRCVSRCVEYSNLDPSCTFEPDPEDPSCCSVPRCPTPVPHNTLHPDPTQGAVTVPPGFVTGDNHPPGVTGGTPGVCEYNNKVYQQGETWDDGCDYTCVCEDALTGKYKCTEKCVRYDTIPAGCRLVQDFANQCCKTLRCNPNEGTPTPGTTGKPNPNNPNPTQAPTPGPNSFCVYNNVQYRQGQMWKDGCDKTCRCENAITGLYTCTNRCPEYEELPPECKLVANPQDPCCLVPLCAVPTYRPTGAPNTNQPVSTPVPIPGVSTLAPDTNAPIRTPSPSGYPTPPGVTGKVTGRPQYSKPTMGPNGETPSPRPPLTYCEYKGSRYGQSEKWEDGCDYNCECTNALTGNYECVEKCPIYPQLPANCRMVKDTGNPCCMVPECGPTPSSTQSPHPMGSTLTPPVNPHSTGSPQTLNPRTEAPPKDKCIYKDKPYSTGQTWYDGCDYKCVCENGAQGLYTCNDRCPVYSEALPTGCIWVPDPTDPLCCHQPDCTFTPHQANSTGFIFPTPPLAKVTGGSATPFPTQPAKTPLPGSTSAPLPGQTTPTLMPTIPNNVCVYQGRTYRQGQRWRDGCNYDCVCEDAQRGHYTCTEICPKNPPSLPPQCRLVRDTLNPCCEKPFCEATTPPVLTPGVNPTGSPQPGVSTLTPLPGSTGSPNPVTHKTLEPPKNRFCLYNGVQFRQGESWNDGCDLKCVCEDSSTGYYRCDQRCPRYDHVPAGCTLVMDPRDSCCQLPVCPPMTSVPTPGGHSTPAPGSTLTPPNPNNPHPGMTSPRIPFLIPTAIPGKIQGQGVTPTPGTTEKPNPNNPFPTYAPTRAPGCLYKGVVYHQGDKFSDGCLYDCICMDDSSGRYTCTEKCPVFPSLPPNCRLVNNPSNPCCKTPQCITHSPLLPPTATPPPGNTLVPPQGQPSTPAPPEVCIYMGKSYTQGQQWYDDCSKVCVCEDAKASFYTCSDRCAAYDNVPAGCTLVADPNDPLCCTVPQCAPTPNPNFPNPTHGPVVIASQPPGKVTGIAPVPIPTTAKPGDTTPVPKLGCMYKGMTYAQRQRWQDGCDYNCICDDGTTGQYSCTQRCPPTGPVQPRCKLQQDPKDYCCMQQVCDFSLPTPTSGVPDTPHLGSTLTPPTQRPGVPGVLTTPKPTPPAVCVYQGLPYTQGQSWQEGCSRTCRCEDAVKNLYSCSDRCPTYQLQSGCQMVTNPQDPCCQVPQCYKLVTPPPTTHAPLTPFLNGSIPTLVTLKPGLLPPLEPSPVPVRIPGVVSGTLQTPTGYCEYKGHRYTSGQKWDDGCDYHCECMDQISGMYRCTQRCPPMPSIPPYCTLVTDPNDQCCQTPYCPGLLTPAPRSTPTPVNPQTPGTGTTITPGTTPQGQTPPVGTTGVPLPNSTPFTPFPILPQNSVPIPTGTAHPLPKDVCIMSNKAYTQGQQWFDGCDRKCVCEDGKTGFYSCTDRCATYNNIGPDCIMVPDPKDPGCCQAPQCAPPSNPNIPPTGIVGVVTGNGLPPIPTPSPGGPSVPPPTQAQVCVYKGSSYKTGQTWQDGCDYECTCIDDSTGQYRCTDRCKRWPNLPTTCTLVYDPSNPCCKKPLCGDNRPTPPPTMAPTTGPNGETPTPPPTTPSPNAFCVYGGVPYRQGQSWQVGCSKMCRCEDAMTRQVTCTDRCPSFPSIQAGCQLTTDTQDPCCQMLRCTPQVQPGTNILIPPVLGVVTGGSTPQIIGGQPSNVGGAGRCLYNGKAYRQGQSWSDGCSYNCVCVDELSGKYMCKEKCPRFENIPATCTLVQDPKDPCCKQAVCPDLKPPTPTAINHSPTPTGPLMPVTPALTPPPQGVCVYGNSYYKAGQQWFDGCDKVCRCEDASRNFYRCDDRCAQYTIPSGCKAVPDPKDPMCCEVPQCPLIPVGGSIPTVAGFLTPGITPAHGFVVGDGKIPTPIPTPTRHPGDTTPALLPQTGCYFKNQVYQKGQKWDDGCDYQCECVDDMTGQYRCTDKCPPMPNNLPDASRCRLVQDPQNPCCSKPYCDFSNNPKPVFPTPVTLPTGATVQYFTPPPQSGAATKPPGFCVYKGVYYRQGDTWDVGCQQTCRCEDVATGFYSCFERCKAYGTLDKHCTLKSDPADPCCVVPDCNVYPVNQPGVTNSGKPKPMGVYGGTITGLGGTNPLGNSPGNSITGSRKECVYKGVPYRNGQVWEDGCDTRCECVDANRGQYRCTDRCPAYYFLPAGCHYEQDPSDACCKIASCTGTPPPLVSNPTLPPTITGAVITSPQDQCVYRDGKQYGTGAVWSDGCSLNCKCEDGLRNKYICHERCPVFASLPSYCHLVADASDNCCKKPECTNQLTPIVGNGGPTSAPTLPPDVLNVVPLGTHTVISGRSPMTPGYSGPAVVGTRQACVYKNKAYRQAESWADGCDYVCVCDDASVGAYTCTSKCPMMPPLPRYCQTVTIPGQCCPSVTCNVPNQGVYHPVPELTVNNIPTPGPTQSPGDTHTTPQIQIIVPVQGPSIGGNLPGGGTLVPAGTNVGNLTGVCVTKDNKMYKPGETWDQGCDYKCTCLDARSGYYSCDPMCHTYEKIPSECTLQTPPGECCAKVLCRKPDGSVVDVGKQPNMTDLFPIVVSTQVGFTGFRPGFLAGHSPSFTGQSPRCIYKGVPYSQGAKWEDGCDFECHCENAQTRQFVCKPKCTRYVSVPSYCQLVKDPQGCCDLLNCQAPTTPDPRCRDALADCDSYGKGSCTGQYEPWARKNCAVYCGYQNCSALANSTASMPGTTPSCPDKLPNCADYADDACKGDYEPWARENCPARCNLCPNTPHGNTSGCWDLRSDCQDYLNDGVAMCVAPYQDWARKNCNATCGFCSTAVGTSNLGFSGTNTGHIGVAAGSGTSVGAYSQPGWVTLLKGVHGVPDDLYRLWASSDTRNPSNPKAMVPTDEFKGNFKPALSNYWSQCAFKQVKVAIWNKGQEKANIIFDATGTDKFSWFDPKRIISSTFTDLKNAHTDMFKLQGDSYMGREFYISQDSMGQGCAGSGWIMVSTKGTCFYERSGANNEKPSFYYSPGTTATGWASRQEGDVFIIAGKGGSCQTNSTGNNSSSGGLMCHYKGNTYKTGETWQDGCEKNCTCRDQNVGFFQCDNLCPQYSQPLPQGCMVEKVPGKCCEKLTCPQQQHSGCYYQGRFYGQDAVWDDGCDYKCTCEDVNHGFYTCHTKCPIWNLPKECFLAAAPQGKCCPVPNCPAGIVVQYPPGYKAGE